MSGSITRAPCPQCLAVGGLWIDPEVFVSIPLGSFSLAGNQIKTTGQFQPVLKCNGCDLNLPGRYDGEGYCLFDPPPTEGKPGVSPDA